MTNICRCGTYNRIRAAIHGRRRRHRKAELAIHATAARRRAMHGAAAVLRPRSLPPRLPGHHGRRRRRPRARLPRARLSAGTGAARRPGRDQRLGRHQARRHGRHPHRPLRDGPGHADRPRPAGRRGARVRLVARSRPNIPTPGQNLARNRVWGNFATGGSRGIRELARLRAQGRRGGAHDAGAGRGRRSGRCRRPSCTRRRQRHHARHLEPHAPTYGKVAAAAAKLPTRPRTSRSRTRRTGRSPASG